MNKVHLVGYRKYLLACLQADKKERSAFCVYGVLFYPLQSHFKSNIFFSLALVSAGIQPTNSYM